MLAVKLARELAGATTFASNGVGIDQARCGLTQRASPQPNMSGRSRAPVA